MLYRFSFVLFVFLVVSLADPYTRHDLSFLKEASAQPIEFGIGVSASVHRHVYEEPLEFWDNSQLVFPSVTLKAEIPMSIVGGPLAKKLFLRSGLRYTRLASQVDWAQTTSPGDTEGQVFSGQFSINQHYVALPLQLRLVIGNSPVFLMVGPEFGLLLFAVKKSDTLTPVEFKTSQKEAVGDDIKRFHAALSGGLGVQFSDRMRSYVRYSEGLGASKKDDQRTVLVTDWHTREVEVGVEFIFKR